MLTEDFLTTVVIPASFTCNIVAENILVSNVYELKIGIDPLEDGADNLGIGFQKIKFLIDAQLQNSVFVNQAHSLVSSLDTLENNLVLFPSETYDYYVGSVLMAKLQAITEKYFEIRYLSIASLIGDSIQYNIIDPYDSELDLDGEHWWNSDDICTGSKTDITWGDLKLTENAVFTPKVIRGGLSES